MSLKPKKHPLSPIKNPLSVSLPSRNLGDCEKFLDEITKKLLTLDCKEAESLYDFLKRRRKLTKQLCRDLKILFIDILNKKQRNKQQNDEKCIQLKSKIMCKISELLRSARI